MPLNLTKPLIVLDIESTGLDIAKDRIVEISLVKLHPDGTKEAKTRRLNPTIPISEEAYSIHHISNEDVANEPTFREIAKSLAKWMEGCDLAGYNSNHFDLPLLAEEFQRAGIDINLRERKMVDIQNIFHKMEPRTLSAAYKFYCHQELEDAHSAFADASATLQILEAQVEKYNLQNNIDFLADFSTRSKTADYAGRFVFNDKKEVVVNFGKYKGRVLKEVLQNDPGYYGWFMKADFTRDSKRVMAEVHTQIHGLK